MESAISSNSESTINGDSESELDGDLKSAIERPHPFPLELIAIVHIHSTNITFLRFPIPAGKLGLFIYLDGAFA